ncbi:PorT family protein [Pontibacter sp. KCTC 32443]|uniref:porin family protein n=1 Tax=Pontibacter TaxID=323449 RepID=UPI00164E703D|nr:MULTISPECIES: porin family protein [Pontibacter]MBC5772897.1 PorT family protein [Pontibacter sp. KCTC 32443]
MKKTILLLSLVLLATTGFAQQLGIKAGATYNNFKGDDAKNYDYRLGYTAGLILQNHITDLIGIQVETLYTSKGAKQETTLGNGSKAEDKFRLNYVDVPVLLHVSAGGLFFDLGPQVSFIAKGRRVSEVTSATGNTTTTVETEITDHPYQVDFAYVGDIGYRAGNGFGLELRYAGGLKKIDDEGPFTGDQRRNSSIMLMFSYLFQ